MKRSSRRPTFKSPLFAMPYGLPSVVVSAHSQKMAHVIHEASLLGFNVQFLQDEMSFLPASKETEVTADKIDKLIHLFK